MLAHWWADTLGYAVRAHSEPDRSALRDRGIFRVEDDPELAVDPIDEPGPTLWFNRVSESNARRTACISTFGGTPTRLRLAVPP